jgi:hypothetical protein
MYARCEVLVHQVGVSFSSCSLWLLHPLFLSGDTHIFYAYKHTHTNSNLPITQFICSWIMSQAFLLVIYIIHTYIHTNIWCTSLWQRLEVQTLTWWPNSHTGIVSEAACISRDLVSTQFRKSQQCDFAKSRLWVFWAAASRDARLWRGSSFD